MKVNSFVINPLFNIRFCFYMIEKPSQLKAMLRHMMRDGYCEIWNIGLPYNFSFEFTEYFSTLLSNNIY
jgi:23S rRNA C2498 (ribose-2'-O)-methylase RlmM